MMRHFRAVALAAAFMCSGFIADHVAASENSESSFRVEQANVDIGTIVAGTIGSATFVFHNDGPDDVRILRAKPS